VEEEEEEEPTTKWLGDNDELAWNNRKCKEGGSLFLTMTAGHSLAMQTNSIEVESLKVPIVFSTFHLY